jgi:hypothetical protein
LISPEWGERVTGFVSVGRSRWVRALGRGKGDAGVGEEVAKVGKRAAAGQKDSHGRTLG